MKINKLIQKAIKNGWKYKGKHKVKKLRMLDKFPPPVLAKFYVDGVGFGITKEQAVLDPHFWEALGYTMPALPMIVMVDYLSEGGDLDDYLDRVYFNLGYDNPRSS